MAPSVVFGLFSALFFLALRRTSATWELVFSDEFNGTGLNTSVWNIKNNESHCCGPFGGQGELELYTHSRVRVSDGMLKLTTSRETVVGPKGQLWNFTSGWVDTKNKFSQKWGKFEANCSLPARSATGIWPAFWLLPQAPECWPTGGEIDIFEFNGNWLEDKIFGSYHFGNACGKDKAPIPGKGFKPEGASSDWQMGWHVYTIEWSPSGIDFFLDGEKYFSRDASKVALPDSPMYIIFDQAVDATVFPPSWGPANYTDVVFKIDYVRVYSGDGPKDSKSTY